MPSPTKDAAPLGNGGAVPGRVAPIAELHRKSEQALRRRAARQPLGGRAPMVLAAAHRCQGNFAAAVEIYEQVAARRRRDWRKASWLAAMLGQRQLPFAPPSGTWPTPFVRVENFLPRAEHELVFAIALALAPRFAVARVGPAKDRRVDDSHRRGLGLDDVDCDELTALLAPKLHALLPSIQRRLRLSPRSAPDHIGRMDLAACPHGGFTRTHRDTGSRRYADLRLNAIYFFHRQPLAFHGGDLLLYDTDIEAGRYNRFAFSRIAPASNSLVVLPTSCYHEVTEVASRSNTFADVRLSATVVLRRRER